MLMYRPGKDISEGPYSLLDRKKEDITILTPKGPTMLCFAVSCYTLI